MEYFPECALVSPTLIKDLENSLYELDSYIGLPLSFSRIKKSWKDGLSKLKAGKKLSRFSGLDLVIMESIPPIIRKKSLTKVDTR